MILIDNSQLFFSSYFSHGNSAEQISDDLVRHTLLSQYSRINEKFKSKFGELVICNDSGNYWRKDVYSGYKQQRKEKRDNDPVNWINLYETFDKIRDEIRDNLPYKSIRVDRCEADDIMYVLCKNFSYEEKILIVSSDKDMIQLLKFNNVSIFNPRLDKIIQKPTDIDSILFEHILKGDSSDNIPNILTDTDLFLKKTERQKPMTIKKIQQFKLDKSILNENNFKRNRNLIDMTYIPIEYQDTILDTFNTVPCPDRKLIFDYLVSNKMKLILEHVENL